MYHVQSRLVYLTVQFSIVHLHPLDCLTALIIVNMPFSMSHIGTDYIKEILPSLSGFPLLVRSDFTINLGETRVVTPAMKIFASRRRNVSKNPCA